MTVLEGMACGHPVVTSSSAGASALIEDGVNGMIFDEPSKLPGILRRLLDPYERRRLGIQARETAQKHTWDIAADKYENLFYQVAQEKDTASLKYNLP